MNRTPPRQNRNRGVKAGRLSLCTGERERTREMDFFTQLIQNRAVIAAFIAWFSAQLIKVILTLVIHKSFDLERMFGAGGMPSSHSALVVALTVMVARLRGPGSLEFAICAVFGLIVLYDAMGVRRQAGKHAKMLNFFATAFQKESEQNSRTPKVKFEELKELIGHTPLEVLGGIVLGAVVGLLV